MDFLVTLFDRSSAPVNCVKGGATMPNIKSAKKRVLVSQAKADRNKSARSKVKTYIKKVESAVAAGDKAAAQAAVVEAESVMRKAASKGVYHDNTVSRKISRMNKAVNAMN